VRKLAQSRAFEEATMSKIVTPAVGPEFAAREGLTGEILPWEDGLRADTGRGSFEWWYFDAHLDDGSTAVVTYMTKGLLQRNDPLTPMVALTITPPDGRKRSAIAPFPPGDFSASPDRCAVRIGPSRAGFVGPIVSAAGSAAPWSYELLADTGDLSAHLVFTGTVPPWRPGAGKNYYDSALTRYFAWLPAIPFGTVTGELRYDGKTRQVTGTGYHDHNWGNIGLNDVMSHWFWGRAHVADYTLIYVEMVSNKAYGSVKLPVFMLAKGERILVGDGTPLRLEAGEEVRHEGGRSYPRRLDWCWEEGERRVRLALRNPQLIEAASLLDLLPPWKKRLARLVANPYYFRFNAELELDVALDSTETVRGPALYELMLLR
jgi:hypothetical protein